MSGTRLRIAHISGTFPPYRSGTGSVVWHETHQLARRGHDVHVFTPAPHAASAAPPGVTVHMVRPWLRVGNATSVPGILPRLRGFDLLHLHYPFFSAECVWAAARLYRTPYVVHYVHDVELRGPLALVPGIYQALVGRHVLEHADRLLFATMDYARASAVRGLAGRATVREHGYGVDEREFHPGGGDTALRATLRQAPEDVVLLFVASLDRAHYFKGLHVLFKALQLLARADVRLVVVGDGDMRSDYAADARRSGLGDRVRFVGSVSDALLPSYYTAADVLVLASVTRSEAYGLVLLEAMACRTPVLASCLPGVRQIVNETGGGLLAIPGDPEDLARGIRRLVEDPALRAALGERGRQSVEARFRWSFLGEQLEEIYTDLLADVRSSH